MSSHTSITVVVALGLTALAAPTRAQEPEVPGPSCEDVMNLEDIGSAAISPDGGAIAYVRLPLDTLADIQAPGAD